MVDGVPAGAGECAGEVEQHHARNTPSAVVNRRSEAEGAAAVARRTSISHIVWVLPRRTDHSATSTAQVSSISTGTAGTGTRSQTVETGNIASHTGDISTVEESDRRARSQAETSSDIVEKEPRGETSSALVRCRPSASETVGVAANARIVAHICELIRVTPRQACARARLEKIAKGTRSAKDSVRRIAVSAVSAV